MLLFHCPVPPTGGPPGGGYQFVRHLLLRGRKFCFFSHQVGLTFRFVKRWFDRTFALGLPAAGAPALLDRLRGAPDRAAALLGRVQDAQRIHRPHGRWSIQEHVGHLLDLEDLWAKRLDDFARGADVLHPADLENRRTFEARHNERQAGDLLDAFRTARTAIVARLERMTPADLSRTARHPRLGQPMSVVDLCYFVAEHDDHHLDTAAGIAARLATIPQCAIDLVNAVDAAEPRLRQMDQESTLARPAPGKWSPREIVGHLVDSASNNHQRFVRATFRDDLVFDGYEQDSWVTAQRYQEAPWGDLVALWASFNRHLAHVMTAVPDPVRRRPAARHNFDRIAFRSVPATQPATLEYFMEDYVLHLKHHLAQIWTLTD